MLRLGEASKSASYVDINNTRNIPCFLSVWDNVKERWLVMADSPSSESKVNESVGNILKVKNLYLADEIRTIHSQSQEGRGRKLTLQMPIPPPPTGREALSHVLPSMRLTLRISLRGGLSKLS